MEEHAVQQNLTDQHLPRMIPSGWVGAGTRQAMQPWPHHSAPKRISSTFTSGRTPALQLRNASQDKWTTLYPFVCFAKGVLLCSRWPQALCCYSKQPVKSCGHLLLPASATWIPLTHQSQCLSLRFPSSAHPNWSPLKSQCCHKALTCFKGKTWFSILRNEFWEPSSVSRPDWEADTEPGLELEERLWQSETRLPVARANKWGSTVSTRDSRLCTDVMDSFP